MKSKGTHVVPLLTVLAPVLVLIGRSGLLGERSFWQEHWSRVLDWLGDEVTVWVYGTTLVRMVTYWSVGGLYTVLDLTGKPAALKKYKVQPGVNEPVDARRLIKAMGIVLVNQLLVGVPVAYLRFWLMTWRGVPPMHELPSLTRLLRDVACLLVLYEIGFYYSHRMLHHRVLYRHVHKQHHEWSAPVAVTAVYCHPFEHLVSNLMPQVLAATLVGVHLFTVWLWFAMITLNTLNAHSGYHLPFLLSPELHDFHHLKFNQCYGALGVLDRIHGTDEGFRRSSAFSRHRVLLGLNSARELFSDQCDRREEDTRPS